MKSKCIILALLLSLTSLPVSAQCSNTRNLAGGYVEIRDCWGKKPCITWKATKAFADEWSQNAIDADHCVRQG